MKEFQKSCYAHMPRTRDTAYFARTLQHGGLIAECYDKEPLAASIKNPSEMGRALLDSFDGSLDLEGMRLLQSSISASLSVEEIGTWLADFWNDFMKLERALCE